MEQQTHLWKVTESVSVVLPVSSRDRQWCISIHQRRSLAIQGINIDDVFGAGISAYICPSCYHSESRSFPGTSRAPLFINVLVGLTRSLALKEMKSAHHCRCCSGRKKYSQNTALLLIPHKERKRTAESAYIWPCRLWAGGMRNVSCALSYLGYHGTCRKLAENTLIDVPG